MTERQIQGVPIQPQRVLVDHQVEGGLVGRRRLHATHVMWGFIGSVAVFGLALPLVAMRTSSASPLFQAFVLLATVELSFVGLVAIISWLLSRRAERQAPRDDRPEWYQQLACEGWMVMGTYERRGARGFVAYETVVGETHEHELHHGLDQLSDGQRVALLIDPHSTEHMLVVGLDSLEFEQPEPVPDERSSFAPIHQSAPAGPADCEDEPFECVMSAWRRLGTLRWDRQELVQSFDAPPAESRVATDRPFSAEVSAWLTDEDHVELNVRVHQELSGHAYRNVADDSVVGVKARVEQSLVHCDVPLVYAPLPRIDDDAMKALLHRLEACTSLMGTRPAEVLRFD